VPVKQRDIQEYTLEELVCKVRTSGQIKLPRYWAEVVVPEGTKPCPYAAAYCYGEMSLRILTNTTSGHPVTTIERETVRRPIVVQPTKYVVADEPHVLIRGYLSDDEKIVNSAQVADQMAYLHTKRSDGTCLTFPEKGNRPITGFETVPSALSMCPPEVGPDHNANRFKYFALYQSNNIARGQAKVKLGRSLAQEDPRVEVESEKVRFLRTHAPKLTGVCTIEHFYGSLQRHRAIRGEDNNSRSRLTAGYYIASMSRSNESVFWVTADILNVLSQGSIDTVFIHNPQTVKSTVIQALIANKMKVVVRGRAPFGYKKNENLTYAESYPPGTLFYDSNRLYEIPSVAGKGSVATYSDAEMKVRIQNWYDTNSKRTCAMAHVYFHPSMTQEWFPALLPSVHCHAGHMIMLNTRSKLSLEDRELELKKQLVRASIANKFKTNFPIGRMTFVRADRSAPKFLWDRGFTFPSRMVDKMKEIDQDLAYEWAPVETKILSEKSDFPLDEIVLYSDQELEQMRRDQQQRRDALAAVVVPPLPKPAPVVVLPIEIDPGPQDDGEDEEEIEYG